MLSQKAGPRLARNIELKYHKVLIYFSMARRKDTKKIFQINTFLPKNFYISQIFLPKSEISAAKHASLVVTSPPFRPILTTLDAIWPAPPTPWQRRHCNMAGQRVQCIKINEKEAFLPK